MSLKIYVSATFADLEQHRERVYQALRALRHDVIAMEDYVATDARPLDKCLRDVRQSDIYIGIFAWRYGYVPTKDNPRHKSITELELHEAERLGKPCLIFLLKSTAPWPPSMMDATTGDNERGARMVALRDELQRERLVGMFETAEELATKVLSAVYAWQIESSRVAPIGVDPAAAPGEPARARVGYDKLWMPASRLRMRFLNGELTLHQRVLRLAQIWTAYANISFEASDDDAAEIRVAFGDDDATWSYLGPDALAIDPREHTVYLGRLRADTQLDELETVVLHEFGHALGLEHEHNNPDADIAWNKKAIYAQMGGPPNSWSKDLVDHMVLRTWPRSRFPFNKPFDPSSIMAFPIPAEWTKNGMSIGRNVTISAGDREFISRLYPYEASTVTRPRKKQTVSRMTGKKPARGARPRSSSG